MGLGRRKGPCGFRRSSFSRQTDVLVVANGFLAEALKHRMLIGYLSNPVLHELHHFPLDLGLGVVEVRMEPVTSRKTWVSIDSLQKYIIRTSIGECPR
jgi:hypothetical protein